MTNIHPNIISHLNQDEKIKSLTEKLPLYIDYTPGKVPDQLIKSVISQQLSTQAAQSIYKRFLSLLPPDADVCDSILLLEDDALRSAGLSLQKIRYIRHIAEHFAEAQYKEEDWRQWEDDTIIEKLTSIKGVGKWTVQMLLIFTLHRPDVLPYDDLIIRKSIVRLYGIQSSGRAQVQEIERVAEVWRPYRSIACRYLWAAKDIILS